MNKRTFLLFTEAILVCALTINTSIVTSQANSVEYLVKTGEIKDYQLITYRSSGKDEVLSSFTSKDGESVNVTIKAGIEVKVEIKELEESNINYVVYFDNIGIIQSKNPTDVFYTYVIKTTTNIDYWNNSEFLYINTTSVNPDNGSLTLTSKGSLKNGFGETWGQTEAKIVYNINTGWLEYRHTKESYLNNTVINEFELISVGKTTPGFTLIFMVPIIGVLIIIFRKK